MRFSSIPITFTWIAVNFVFLNCIFTTMNHLKTGKNREEVECEESLIYRVDVLRNSASNVDCLPQIWQIPANYPLWSFIPQNTTDYNFIPKYPFMTSFPALSKLDFCSKIPFSTKFLRFPPWSPPLVEAILKLSIQTGKIQPELFKFRTEDLAHARRWQCLFNIENEGALQHKN